MGSFSTFPPELLGAIVQEVRSTPALLQLRATNSTLNTLSTPLAFKFVCLENRDKSIENFKLLVKSRLAPYVREVVFQYREQETYSESGPSDSYAQGYDGEGFMEALCNFTHFPALESLVLHFREDDGPFKSDTEGNSDETRFPDSYIIQSLVFNTLAARGFPQLLKSLTIDKYLPLGHPVFGSRSGTAFLSNLNHLAIKTTTQCAALPMTDPRSEVHGNAIFEKAIVPASLVSLEVHHADVRSAGMTIPVEEIHLPRLERLSFQRAYFSELEGGKIQDEMEGFIVRHGSTLRELEIFLCPMALSTTLSGEPPARFRRWAQVWEHLSGELKVLRNLVVSGRHDSKGVEDDSVPRYVDNCYYCNEVELSEAEIVEDESALRLFREKVESRLPQ